MKYCVKCGSPLEEHSLFCVSCGTPVEEDGIFYEEEFYLPKRVLKRYKQQGTPIGSTHDEKKKTIPRIALMVGLMILLIVSVIFLYGDNIFSKYTSQHNEDINKNSNTNKINDNKSVVNIDEAETAFTPVGDTTNIDEKISNDEDKNKEMYINLLNSIEEKANSSFTDFQGEYSLGFKDLDNEEGLYVGSDKIESGSVIKIFIMIEAYDQMSKGLIKPDDVIVLKDYMKAEGSGVIATYPSDTEITYEDLVILMMNKSDNTAANILIDKLGFNAINNRIKALGCSGSELNRRMMDESAINNGIENYISIKDLAMVLEKIYMGQCVDKDYDKKIIEVMENNEQKDKIPRSLSADVKVANKAGDYNNISNDAGIIFTEKGAYILCIATKGNNLEDQTKYIGDLSKNIYDLYISYKDNL